MVESQDDWSDFDHIRASLSGSQYTVDKLKQLIIRLNDISNHSLLRTGKKAELISRVQVVMDSWRRNRDVNTWRQAREVFDEVHTQSTASSSRRHPPTHYPNAPVGVPAPAPNAYQYPGAIPYASNANTAANFPHNPRPAAQPPLYAVPAHPHQPAIKSDIRFAPSPFYRVLEAVTELAITQEAKDPTERKTLTLPFSLNANQRERLSSPNSNFQLRLYCTSSTHYSGSAYGRVNPCPIEFPTTCEVRVNGTLLSANLRGLKKKPGTAPPADLGKTVRLAHSGSNKLDMIFMNNQTPFQPKRFYAVVNLVEVTSVQQVVDRLRKGKYRDRDDVLAGVKARRAEDDDIVAGPSSLSLKCPMSYVRIKIPSRSKYCVHSQCFDAESWFSVMEQTTTWLCPVCEKTLVVEDLIVDGFFNSILQSTPDSVDDVILEADGEWHTTDNKYSSAGWKKKALPSSRKPSGAVNQSPTKKEPATTQSGPPAGAQVYVIDSDDEEEEESRVKKEISPTVPINSRPLNGPIRTGPMNLGLSGDVIDLTLSDDDEVVPPSRSALTLTLKRPAPRPSYSPPPLPAAKRQRLNGGDFRQAGGGAVHGWSSPGGSGSPGEYDDW